MINVRWLYLLLLFSGCGLAGDWHKLYGDKIAFDVYRHDIKVGSYQTTFSSRQGGWDIVSKMDIAVPILLFFSFDYAYEAKEVWREGLLKKLDVHESRNGDIKKLQVAVNNKGYLTGTGQSGDVSIKLPILTTSHYNADVINNYRILNTLTGQENEYTLERLEREYVSTNKGDIEADRYRYGGDLIGTDVWYSLEGHWVKMEFTGDDDSKIELRCLYCMR